MTDIRNFFDRNAKRSVQYVELDQALASIGGSAEVQRTRDGAERLYVHDAAGALLYRQDLHGDRAEMVSSLSSATAAVYEEIRQRQVSFEDSVSQAVLAYAAAEGEDAGVDFEGSLGRLIADLRRKCEAEGMDFDALSRDVDTRFGR